MWPVLVTLIRLVVILIDGPSLAIVLLFGDYLVTWHSKKQNVVACSSVEVEYRVVAYNVS